MRFVLVDFNMIYMMKFEKTYMEYAAKMDIDFPEALELIDEKQDLLDYLQSLTENINAINRSFPFKIDIKHCGSIVL